jgi:hypothetical protein
MALTLVIAFLPFFVLMYLTFACLYHLQINIAEAINYAFPSDIDHFMAAFKTNSIIGMPSPFSPIAMVCEALNNQSFTVEREKLKWWNNYFIIEEGRRIDLLTSNHNMKTQLIDKNDKASVFVCNNCLSPTFNAYLDMNDDSVVCMGCIVFVNPTRLSAARLLIRFENIQDYYKKYTTSKSNQSILTPRLAKQARGTGTIHVIIDTSKSTMMTAAPTDDAIAELRTSYSLPIDVDKTLNELKIASTSEIIVTTTIMTELLSGMGYTVKLMSIKDYIATLIDPNSNQIEAKSTVFITTLIPIAKHFRSMKAALIHIYNQRKQRNCLFAQNLELLAKLEDKSYYYPLLDGYIYPAVIINKQAPSTELDRAFYLIEDYCAKAKVAKPSKFIIKGSTGTRASNQITTESNKFEWTTELCQNQEYFVVQAFSNDLRLNEDRLYIQNGQIASIIRTNPKANHPGYWDLEHLDGNEYEAAVKMYKPVIDRLALIIQLYHLEIGSVIRVDLFRDSTSNRTFINEITVSFDIVMFSTIHQSNGDYPQISVLMEHVVGAINQIRDAHSQHDLNF